MFASLPRKLAVTNATTFGIASGNCGFNSSPTLCYDADFTPYGQEISFSARLQTTACSPSYKFTGYERDSESGNDYAMARYHINRFGRFSSPDRLAGGVTNPQSLNRFAYTLNDPTNLVDPLGLAICFVDVINGNLVIECSDSVTVTASSGGAIGAPSNLSGRLSEPAVHMFLSRGDNGINTSGNTSGGAGGGQQGAPTAPTLSPAAQSCVNQANQQVQNQLQTFSGYAGTKLLGRAIIGAGSGAVTGLIRASKTDSPWLIASGAVAGAAVGVGWNIVSDVSTIRKIQNSFMDKFVACMQNASVPKPPE